MPTFGSMVFEVAHDCVKKIIVKFNFCTITAIKSSINPNPEWRGGGEG